MTMTTGKIRILVLLASVAGSVSCGLVRLPFHVAGHVTRGTIHAGESIYQKSKDGIERRKQKRQEQEETGDDAKRNGDKGSAKPQNEPQNGGLLPDLPEIPDENPPATPPPETDARPNDARSPAGDGGEMMVEPPLPQLPD